MLEYINNTQILYKLEYINMDMEHVDIDLLLMWRELKVSRGLKAICFEHHIWRNNNSEESRDAEWEELKKKHNGKWTSQHVYIKPDDKELVECFKKYKIIKGCKEHSYKDDLKVYTCPHWIPFKLFKSWIIRGRGTGNYWLDRSTATGKLIKASFNSKGHLKITKATHKYIQWLNHGKKSINYNYDSESD